MVVEGDFVCGFVGCQVDMGFELLVVVVDEVNQGDGYVEFGCCEFDDVIEVFFGWCVQDEQFVKGGELGFVVGGDGGGYYGWVSLGLVVKQQVLGLVVVG